ncbi:hypothetical protein [Agromyces sp. LHK192]|uniref:hypothetical protein n=1 Tax=Agromyces sp. LHK192 TaxID=2498704 RepID=UPI000FDA7FE1|nr:hypothetical protein [Agromyces sp. LHK192]
MDERAHGRDLLRDAATELLDRPDVESGRFFGSDGLGVRGKLFAFVGTDGELVLKLPSARIDELALEHMVMRGRPMREWAVVPQTRSADWRDLTIEAHAFVDAITP